MPPPPPDDSDVPPPPPPPPADDSLTDDSDLPPPPPEPPADDIDVSGWPPPPPPVPDDSYAGYDDGAYYDGQWSPPDDGGLGPGLQSAAFAEIMGDMLPPPSQDEDEFDDGSYNQVADPGLAEVVDLQLTADESSGFGLGLDPFLVVDKVNGPARRDGWQLGWTVLAVQGQPVSDHSQLVQQLSRAGKTAQFTVLVPRPAAAEAAELAPQEAAAATVLQSRFRGNQSRVEYKQQRAARAIQSRYRGHRSRTQLHVAREKEVARAKAWESYRRPLPKTSVSRSVQLPNSTSSERSAELLLAERAAVATKMQATFRGKQTRKNLKLGKPPPGLERQLRLAREREYLSTHAPMHQSYLQQLQATAKQLATELQQSGIEAATVLQQPPPDLLPVPTVSLAQAEQDASNLCTRRTTVLDKSQRTLDRTIRQDDQARYWREAWDSQYNCPYYWHKKTKEVRWEMPAGFSRSHRQNGGASARSSAIRELPVRSASSYRSAGSAVQSSRGSMSRTRRLSDSSRGGRTSRRPGTMILYLPS